MFALLLARLKPGLAGLWTGPSDLPRPLRLERRLVLGRWLGIATFSLALATHALPSDETVAAYGVLLVAAAYNLVLLYLLRQPRMTWLLGILPTIGDGLLCAAMLTLVGGFETSYYNVLYAVLVASAMRLGFAQATRVAILIGIIDLGVRVSHGQGLDAAYIVRTGVLFLTVQLTSFLFDESKQTEADLAERLRHSEVLNGALEHQALHDLLTGLPNRMLLHTRVQQAIAAPDRGDTSVALLIIDLDRFKEINDTYGHHYGDLLLQEIGPRLQNVVDDSATIARLGGDEFAVLLPATDARHAELLARKLLSALEHSFTISDDNVGVDVGGSIGIALSPAHGADSDVLLRRADVAMYLAKRDRSGFAIYAPELDQHTPERLAMVGELRRAIDGDELRLVFQPKVSLRSGEYVGAEALIRWQHPQRGMIPPDQFIPLAEQTGLIKNVSQWVLSAALRQAREWLSMGLNVPIAVNLSMRDLHDAELPETVAGLLRQWHVPPSMLLVEITENGLMADPTRALQVMSGLRELGLRIAIDDFGTGYSSLAYLKRLPVDELKIDRSFIRDLATDTDDLAIVRSTISLGHDLGLSIVAEGVEDAGTLDLLGVLGCDVAQGYFTGRPMSAAALVALICEPRPEGALAA
ncbi:MAG TPA: EAL domain-containing protein [Chloroflexota bacterium]|nr:EAL domain-containing protein [Chloroflexota bacterium]